MKNKTLVPPTRRNPVARYAARFQSSKIFRDRSKYRRHDKHKGRTPCPLRIALSA